MLLERDVTNRAAQQVLDLPTDLNGESEPTGRGRTDSSGGISLFEPIVFGSKTRFTLGGEAGYE